MTRPEDLRTITDPALLAPLVAHIESARFYTRAIGREVRDSLDAAGLPQTPQTIHTALHVKLPGIIAGFAEPILLHICREEEAPQEAFDGGMTAVLAWFAGVIRLVFEEFGPADEAAITATVNRCQDALLVRLQTLADAIPAVGHA